MRLPRPDPVVLHRTLTGLWFLAVAPSLLWWKDSVPWLVFMSVWANLGTHWSAYEGAKAKKAVAEGPSTTNLDTKLDQIIDAIASEAV